MAVIGEVEKWSAVESGGEEEGKGEEEDDVEGNKASPAPPRMAVVVSPRFRPSPTTNGSPASMGST